MLKLPRTFNETYSLRIFIRKYVTFPFITFHSDTHSFRDIICVHNYKTRSINEITFLAV